MFLELGLWFLATAIIVLVLGLYVRKIPLRAALTQIGATLLIMLILTAIFDNLMIYSGLFDYGQSTLIGLRIGLAPIEDFLYAACAVLLLPGLWWLLGPEPQTSTGDKS